MDLVRLGQVRERPRHQGVLAHQGGSEAAEGRRGCLEPCHGTRRAVFQDSGRAAVRSRLRVFWARVRGVFGSRQREADLRREISAHIDEAAEEFERQGLSAAEARRRAFAQFGGVTQTIESHRERRGFNVFSTLRQDLKYAVRTLVRAPGFAIVAVLTLAIGILGNTTIFSGVNALLFTPLPAERPEQIAQVLSPTGLPGDHELSKHPFNLYMAMRDHNTAFVALAAIRDVTVPISDT